MKTLHAIDVSRVYDGLAVVLEASIEVSPGKVTALLGGSGAGKSTLLRLFAGLEPVDGGQIRYGDDVLSSTDTTVPAEDRKIGLIFQDFALFPHMTALQNVCFGLKHLPKDQAKRVGTDWLARLGLASRADAFPHHLSGGEQQRVSIARALAPEPRAILMDEPFSGLDPALKIDVRRAALLAIREAGIPALLVTHDAEEAMAHADHLGVMRGGVIVQQGDPETIYTQPVDPETATALGPVNIINPRSPLAPFVYGSGNTILVREDGIRIDPTSEIRARVSSVQRVGGSKMLRLHLTGCDDLVMRIGPGTAPAAGDEVGIVFDPLLAFRFS